MQCGRRRRQAVDVRELTVGLVCDQVDGVAEASFLGSEELGEGGEGRVRIDTARRVVGVLTMTARVLGVKSFASASMSMSKRSLVSARTGTPLWFVM